MVSLGQIIEELKEIDVCSNYEVEIDHFDKDVHLNRNPLMNAKLDKNQIRRAVCFTFSLILPPETVSDPQRVREED